MGLLFEAERSTSPLLLLLTTDTGAVLVTDEGAEFKADEDGRDVLAEQPTQCHPTAAAITASSHFCPRSLNFTQLVSRDRLEWDCWR
jgi:hypothetical protein